MSPAISTVYWTKVQQMSKSNVVQSNIVQGELGPKPMDGAGPVPDLPSTAPEVMNCNWKQLYLPDNVRLHGRMCGSTEGGWFVLVLDRPDEVKLLKYQLFNINSRIMKSLPSMIQKAGEIREFSLEVAVVSSSPSLPGYTVAAIGKDGCSVAIRRYNADHWEDVPCRSIKDDLLVDVIYYKSEFWFLTAGERVGKLVDHDWSGNSKSYWTEMTTRGRDSYNSDAEETDKPILETKRYLVESKGDLYMVLKVLGETGDVRKIRVFRLQLNDADEDRNVYGSSSDSDDLHCDRLYYTWEEASNELADRNFFIGQASSRSFQTTSTPRIYFLDDAYTRDPSKPGYFLRDGMGFIAMTDEMEDELPETWPKLGSPYPDRSSDKVPPSWWIH